MKQGSIITATGGRERNVRMDLRDAARPKKVKGAVVMTGDEQYQLAARVVTLHVPAGERSTVFDMLGLAAAS